MFRMRLFRHRFLAVLASLPLVFASVGATVAQDASGWSPSAKSRARLVAAGGLENGAYQAGVEIALEGHALTYWRQPGDAGSPPTFEFSASNNVAAVEIAYPAPERHDEAGAEAFGWREGVIFPLTVRPQDPAKPVTLDLDLRYAACENICVPAEGRMRLTLKPADAPTAQAARIAAWRARTPKPAAPGAITLAPERGAKEPSWRVRVTPAPGPSSDLFAEGPEGWYFDTKREGEGFRLTLAERPKDQRATNVRLTYRGPDGAVEQETRLDADAGAP
jgi:DsbC/DsbD-like thiol-disulfide interchange protein